MAQKNSRKALLVSDIVVGAIATQAKQFAEAGRRCLGDMTHGAIPGPIIPGIVCMSFSVELWFKALGCLSDPVGEIPTGHNLLALFNKLSSDIQDALIARCGQTRAPFLRSLEEDARAFETWRYSYEWAARQPISQDGVDLMTVNMLLTDVLPNASEQVYDEFK